MARISQVMAPAIRDGKEMSIIKGNNGYFFINSGVDEWVYWGFPIQIEQGRSIDKIEVDMYGSEPDGGGYIQFLYYWGETASSIQAINSPFGSPGAWSTIDFTQDDIWQEARGRTYWVCFKTKGHRGDSLRVRGINVVYR